MQPSNFHLQPVLYTWSSTQPACAAPSRIISPRRRRLRLAADLARGRFRDGGRAADLPWTSRVALWPEGRALEIPDSRADPNGPRSTPWTLDFAK